MSTPNSSAVWVFCVVTRQFATSSPGLSASQIVEGQHGVGVADIEGE